jgi:hypothetical protein
VVNLARVVEVVLDHRVDLPADLSRFTPVTWLGFVQLSVILKRR